MSVFFLLPPPVPNLALHRVVVSVNACTTVNKDPSSMVARMLDGDEIHLVTLRSRLPRPANRRTELPLMWRSDGKIPFLQHTHHALCLEVCTHRNHGHVWILHPGYLRIPITSKHTWQSGRRKQFQRLQELLPVYRTRHALRQMKRSQPGFTLVRLSSQSNPYCSSTSLLAHDMPDSRVKHHTNPTPSLHILVVHDLASIFFHAVPARVCAGQFLKSHQVVGPLGAQLPQTCRNPIKIRTSQVPGQRSEIGQRRGLVSAGLSQDALPDSLQIQPQLLCEWKR